jgi:agmatinase
MARKPAVPVAAEQAWEDLKGGPWEPTFGGILSFLRRPYSRDLKGVDVAVMGVPYDNATTDRPGTRLGPRAIRAASTGLSELKAFPFGFDLFAHIKAVDYGDCVVNHHLPETVVPSIESTAARIIASGAQLLTLGGDHFITYPLLKAHAAKHGPVALIQFDSHCDTWPDHTDQTMSYNHGSMFLRAANEGLIDLKHSVQVGLRTYNDSAHGFDILTAPWLHRNGIDATIAAIKERVAGGPATWQALAILRGLGDLDLIGMDIVEVSPPFDHAEITAIAAATLAHDYMCLLALKKGAKGIPVGRM